MNLRSRSIALITFFGLFQSLQLHAQVWEYPSSGNTSFSGKVGIGTTPASWLDIVTGTGDGTTNEVNCLRLRQNATTSNTQLLQLGVSNVAAGGNNNGYGYISSVYWGGSENSPLALNPKGGPVGFGLNTGINWNATAKDAVAIRASGSTANNTLMGKLVFAHFGNYIANSSFIAGVYDKSAFYQGAGMVFHTISGSDMSGLEGIERMRISSDGNVGVGTNNPETKFHVNGNLAASVDNLAGFVQLWADNAIIYKNNNNNGLRFGTASNLDAGGWSEKMRLTADGNLGIGTGSPTERLSIQSATGHAVNMALRNTDGTSLLSLATDGTALSYVNSYYGLTFNSNNSPYYSFKLGGSEALRIDGTGNVGIGSLGTPQAKLHVVGGVQAQSGPSVIYDKGTADKQFYLCFYGNGNSQGFIGQPANVSNRIDLGTGSGNITMTLLDGNVGIGTATPQSKLAVNGTVCATKVRVAATGCWADYVFDKGYKLRSLAEVEQYINQHHHLPEVPAAAEVEKNGLDVGDNQATLLKKIEELTLYVIEQNKKLESQQQQIDQLKKEVSKKK